MTVLARHQFDGVAAGTLDTGDAGPIDTHFNSVNGSGLTVDNTGLRPPRMKITKVTSVNAYAEDLFSAKTQGAARFMWVPPAANPGSSFSVLAIRNGTNLCFRVNMLVSSTAIRLLDPSSAVIGSTGSGTFAFDQTKRYRIEVKWHHGAGATGGIELKVFDGDTATQLGSTITATGIDIGSQFTRALWGLEGSTPEVGTFYFDDMVVTDTEAYIGAFVANVAPTVSLAANDDTPDIGQSVTLTATASDTDGSIASYSFSQTAGPAVTLSGSGSTRTFTAPSVGGATTLTFQVVVTDNEGATATATHSVVVNPPSNVAPTATLTADDDTPAGGQLVTLTIGGTDPDGTIASRSVSQTSGPTVTLSGTGTTRTFTAPYLMGDTALGFSGTVTDDDGATSSPATKTVTVQKHRKWAITNTGWHPIISNTLPPADPVNPVVISGTTTPGDKFAQLAWSVDPGDYNVTGVVIDKTPEDWSTTVMALAGTQNFGQLTNGTPYTITVTPIVNGSPDPTFAVDFLVTPAGTGVPLTKFRPLGIYYDTYADDTSKNVFGTKTIGGVVQKKDSEVVQTYHQWGVPVKDPSSTATNGIAPGNPYPDGTWYRDFKNPTWSTWNLTKEKDESDRQILKVNMGAAHSSSAIKFIGQGRPANSSGYDWALNNVIDGWINKVKPLYDYAPTRPRYLVMCSEPEVGANLGSYPNIPGTGTSRITDHVDAAKWMARFLSLFFTRARALITGVKVALWIGGGRSDGYLGQLLTEMVTLGVAPDIIIGDPYVNETANTPLLTNFTGLTNQFRSTTGRYKSQYDDLSDLARPGVAANSGIQIPMAAMEFGIDKQDHTDAEMANILSGAGAELSAREAIKQANLEFACYFNRDSGPQGKHKLDDGSHPLSVAAFRDELFRTDVTG